MDKIFGVIGVVLTLAAVGILAFPFTTQVLERTQPQLTEMTSEFVDVYAEYEKAVKAREAEDAPKDAGISTPENTPSQ
ncbi:hypothetical protein K2X83_00995 [Patescibacteria group bacterium]|nr:hypothetical protein [Patescibacteria group bacterium]